MATLRWRKPAWGKTLERSLLAMTRRATSAGTRALRQALKPAVDRRAPLPGAGDWLPGVAMGTAGMRRFRLYRPPDLKFGERVPLLVMLHGCHQDATAFAASTRMNRIALRERFLVLYPEQDRLSNGQGCWNWFDTGNGRAFAEATLVMSAIDQVCLLQPVDRQRVAIAGLSSGASMAALLATRYPGRFTSVVMHSGIPPGTAHSALTALGAMQGHRAGRGSAVRKAAAVEAWPPLLVIHGDADIVVSPLNGRAAAQAWAEVAGARAGPARHLRRGLRYPFAVTDFKRRGRTAATLVIVDGLGHAWSGGAAGQRFSDAQGPDASRMVWRFVARQFARQAG